MRIFVCINFEIIFSFFFYIYLLTLYWNLGNHFNMVQLMSPALAIIFYYAGVLTQNAHQNWFVGIRTPWTISSDAVWNRTHKLGSKLFEIAGLFILIGTFTDPRISFWFVLVPLLAAASVSVIYSYVLFKREEVGRS